jgi:D-hexose-6-phosphate mutarotase
MNPNPVAPTTGNGGLPLVKVKTPWSTAEIYLHGAHVAGFQKNGEPPLLFLSAKSVFAPSKAIRGGVPICFPWFGPRTGGPAHGFARFTAWELTDTATAPDGSVTIRLQLPQSALPPEWAGLRAEFSVTVAATLTMELVARNESPDTTLAIENCLHTYFHVGDIAAVTLTGLAGAPFDDFAAGATGERKVQTEAALRIMQETNRVYPAATGTVEIHDAQLRRVIRVEKSNSASTVVWNPWTTQKLPDDFDPAEHRRMVCVESGNVKADRLELAPGAVAALRVVLGSRAE